MCREYARFEHHWHVQRCVFSPIVLHILYTMESRTRFNGVDICIHFPAALRWTSDPAWPRGIGFHVWRVRLNWLTLIFHMLPQDLSDIQINRIYPIFGYISLQQHCKSGRLRCGRRAAAAGLHCAHACGRRQGPGRAPYRIVREDSRQHSGGLLASARSLERMPPSLIVRRR